MPRCEPLCQVSPSRQGLTLFQAEGFRAAVAEYSLATRESIVRKRLLLFCLSWLLVPLAVNAQEKASLPYQMAWTYLELFDSLAHLELIRPSINITSTDSSVAPGDIEFRVIVDGAWRSFRVGDSGSMDLPREPDWRDRQLVLISNQPKGSLQLQIGFSAVALPGNPVPYQHLVAIQAQFSEAMKRLSEVSGQSSPEIKGLTLLMPGDAGLEIQGKRKQALKPNSAGIINLAYDARLEQENPPVQFDKPPLGIVPLQKSAL